MEGLMDENLEEEDDRQVSGERQTERRGQWEAPDGGWGWVVLGATVLILALTLGFSSCLGIFYTDLQTAFHASNSQTSWVPSIMFATLHAGGPFCSVLVELYGCRVTVMLGGVLSALGMVASSFTNTIAELYVTAGVITGLGFCFSFQPAVTVLRYYFVRRRVFANAVSSTGTAIGVATLPLLSHFLRMHLDWRGSFLVLGGLLLNCCVGGAVMRPVKGAQKLAQASEPQDNRKEKQGVRGVLVNLLASMRRHLAFDVFCHNRHYRFFSLGAMWMMLGSMAPLIYLVPYATKHGIEKNRTALLFTILGFINITARPLSGLLFSQPWFQGRHAYVLSFALLVNGLSNTICSLAASFPVLLAYILVYGLSMSVVGSLAYTVLMAIVDINCFPAALGLLSIMQSVTILLGPPLAGMVLDSTGQYIYVFYSCSAVVSLAALFFMLSFYWLDHMEKKCALSSGTVPKKASVVVSHHRHCQADEGSAQPAEVPAMDAACISVV